LFFSLLLLLPAFCFLLPTQFFLLALLLFFPPGFSLNPSFVLLRVEVRPYLFLIFLIFLIFLFLIFLIFVIIVVIG